CLIEKSEELNKTLLDIGVSQEDILTTSINQSKEYRWQNNSSVFKGYKTSMTTVITIRDLSVLEELYTDLLLNENISIGNLIYTHSKMDSLNHAAYEQALTNANLLADKLILNMNLTNKEIIRVGNVDLPASSGTYEFESDGKMYKSLKVKKSMIKINNGTVYVYNTLYVEYKLS
ncbi:MAG: SIMPL domain-containing protein, partial [Bacteroidetes bacterium]|nr:SIMPL domain-containing protein [Bacteroidota bacterium]